MTYLVAVLHKHAGSNIAKTVLQLIFSQITIDNSRVLFVNKLNEILREAALRYGFFIQN